MKKIYFLTALILFLGSSQLTAQWTDNGTNLTTTDNVGIGTTSASKPLFVVGENWQESPSIPKVFAVADPSDLTKTISLGYDDNYDGGVIASVDQSTGWKNTLIQPFGGKVGIGTSSPVSLLDVNGDIAIKYGKELRVNVPDTGNGGNWTSSSNKTILKTGWLSGLGDYVDFKVPGAIDNTAIIRFTQHGRFGIGTSSPLELLEVKGNIFANNENSGLVIDAGNYKRVGFMKFVGKEGGIWRASNQDFEIGRVTGTSITDGLGSTPQTDFYISGGGAIGIGTTSPDPAYKLSVNGSIRSKEVKVEADWSDFVFEEDYTLRPLEEVETYIAENKHLPEIPSEAEVTESGINLGEMNAKLLQKIEELTLYMIEMNKQLIEQNKQNQVQQERIEKLENELNELKTK